MLEAAKDNHLNEIKNLWKNSFSLTEEYINFYFNKRYNKNYTLVYTLNNIPISSSQFFPFDMTFYTKIIKTEYLVGVCTHKDHRKKGYTKLILEKGINNAFEKNIDVQILIPQDEYLFNMYSKYGFAKLFDVTKVRIKNSNYPALNVYEYNNKDFKNLYKFYTKWYSSKSCRVIKNIDDFKFIIEEAFVENSKVLIYKKDETILGFALLSVYENKYTIKEILYYDNIVKESLIKKAFEISKANEIEVIFSGKYENNVPHPLGMARVINPIKLLEIYAKNNPTFKFSFKLTDSIIKTNNRIFSVDNSKISVDCVDNYDIILDISHFTQFILGYKAVGNLNELLIKSDAYMNLMLN